MTHAERERRRTRKIRAREWRSTRDRLGWQTVDIAYETKLDGARVVELLCARDEPTAAEIVAIDDALAGAVA